VTQRVLLVVVLGALAAFPAWALISGQGDLPGLGSLDPNVRRVLAWTLAPGASLTRLDPATSVGPWSVELAWELETSQAWPAYRDGLARSAPAGLELRQEAGDRVRYTQRLPGDLHEVEVGLRSAGAVQQVRVRLRATAW
jgi:hypothetical protein